MRLTNLNYIKKSGITYPALSKLNSKYSITFLSVPLSLNIYNKRFMQSRVFMIHTKLSKTTAINIPYIRNYPGEYTTGHFSYDTVKGNGKKLPPHEYGHRVIKRNRDGTIVGGFTSTPKPEFKSELIDSTEYANGTAVPKDAPPGTGQYATVFEKSKIVDEPLEGMKKPIFKPDLKIQAFMDKNEKKLKTLYDNHHTPEIEARIDKNDSRFYHENGQRDYENFP